VLSVAPGASAVARAGAAHELRLRIRVAAGYHVMSNEPSEPQFIPTALSLDAAPDLTWRSPRFPAARAFRSGAREIATFVGEIEVAVPFAVAPGALPGPRAVRGHVSYQACTASSCLFPASVPFTARVDVAPP
jgi:DsbC/DsbD-like thiol-disulfide interchange protein